MMDAHDYIDDYVNALLSEEDKLAFEQLMDRDDELRSLVEQYHNVKLAGSGMQEIGLLAEVEAVGKSMNIDENKTLSKSLVIRVIGVAALLVFLISAWYLFNKSEKNEEPTTIQFADLYKEPIWPVERSVDVDRIGDGVYQYLVNHDLDRAKSILLDSVLDRTMGRYWLAEMYANEGMWDSVGVYLPEENSDLMLKQDKVNYLHVLYLLKSNKIEEAKPLIETLPLDFKSKVNNYLN